MEREERGILFTRGSRDWPSREGGDAQARFNGNLGYLMYSKGAWQESIA